MNKATKYLRTFFDEKDLPVVAWIVDSPNGTPNHFDTDIIIEHLFEAPIAEQEAIGAMIRRIDFAYVAFFSKRFFFLMGPRYYREQYETFVFAMRLGYFWGDI